MVRIRLHRVGKRGQPHFRLVACDRRNSTRGKVLEVLGHYDPISGTNLIVKHDRVKHWISRGAIPTKRAKAVISLAKKVASEA